MSGTVRLRTSTTVARCLLHVCMHVSMSYRVASTSPSLHYLCIFLISQDPSFPFPQPPPPSPLLLTPPHNPPHTRKNLPYAALPFPKPYPSFVPPRFPDVSTPMPADLRRPLPRYSHVVAPYFTTASPLHKKCLTLLSPSFFVNHAAGFLPVNRMIRDFAADKKVDGGTACLVGYAGRLTPRQHTGKQRVSRRERKTWGQGAQDLK